MTFYFNELLCNLLLPWYAENKRLLPWRNSRDPYKIWLSEIILQQTRVSQGLPFYERFLTKFPNIFLLATANENTILRLWQGLGYYSRARNLHECAKMIVSLHHGIFPSTYDELLKLPGIGSYTAAAIASFAFDKPHAVVDGNVFRVLSRIYGITEDIGTSKGNRYFQKLANDLIPKSDPSTFNQAIMEFGALQCVPGLPDCTACPLTEMCFAYKNDAQKQFPVKSKKTPVRHRYFQYIVLKLHQTIYMKPRTEKDIWQGMFDFYLVETSGFLDTEELLERLHTGLLSNIPFEIGEISHNYTHLLSHQHLHANFYSINLTKPLLNKTTRQLRLTGYSRDKIDQLPKPVLISRYLNEYKF